MELFLNAYGVPCVCVLMRGVVIVCLTPTILLDCLGHRSRCQRWPIGGPKANFVKHGVECSRICGK